MEKRREGIGTEIRQDVGRRRQVRCHPCVGTAARAEPLPLELTHPDAARRAQADTVACDVAPMDLSMLCERQGQER